MSYGRIAADGTPGEVFSQVELMEREGLDVPETTRLCWDLNRAGLKLPLDSLDAAGCAEIISRA